MGAAEARCLRRLPGLAALACLCQHAAALSSALQVEPCVSSVGLAHRPHVS